MPSRVLDVLIDAGPSQPVRTTNAKGREAGPGGGT